MEGKEETKELIHVTMYIASPKTAKEVKADKHIHGQVGAAFRQLMHPIENGEELARRLSLPSPAHIQWSVEIAPVKLEGFDNQEQHIPIMVSVGGVPNIMEKLHPEMVEEVTNVLFKQIRKDSNASKELAKALGYEVDKPAKFHLYLPHQVRVREPARPMEDIDTISASPVWVDGGWSKG